MPKNTNALHKKQRTELIFVMLFLLGIQEIWVITVHAIANPSLWDLSAAGLRSSLPWGAIKLNRRSGERWLEWLDGALAQFAVC